MIHTYKEALEVKANTPDRFPIIEIYMYDPEGLQHTVKAYEVDHWLDAGWTIFPAEMPISEADKAQLLALYVRAGLTSKKQLAVITGLPETKEVTPEPPAETIEFPVVEIPEHKEAVSFYDAAHPRPEDNRHQYPEPTLADELEAFVEPPTDPNAPTEHFDPDTEENKHKYYPNRKRKSTT